jgi:hypothetical protein
MMKCAACGSTALIEGSLRENSGGGTGVFQPSGQSAWKRIFGVGTREVRALGCIDCQHLQLVVNFTADDLEGYQEFERQKSGGVVSTGG